MVGRNTGAHPLLPHAHQQVVGLVVEQLGLGPALMGCQCLRQQLNSLNHNTGPSCLNFHGGQFRFSWVYRGGISGSCGAFAEVFEELLDCRTAVWPAFVPAVNKDSRDSHPCHFLVNAPNGYEAILHCGLL